MKVLNKVLFYVKEKPVKIRDVLIIVMIIVLLLLLFQCSKAKTKEEKIEDAVSDICTFPKHNISDLHDLLTSADLCSDPWFEDLDKFIERLQDQNKVLKKKSGKREKAIYKQQKVLVTKLKAFQDNQNETTIDELETAFKAYQKEMKKGCKTKGK